MKPILPFLIGVGLFATPVVANDDATALTKDGLMGTVWAIDCSKPLSASNYYVSYSVGPSGAPVETLRSANADKARELRNVQAISAEWILYTMIDTDNEAVNILTRRQGNRHKSWWSVGEGGTAYIVNGNFPDGGGPPWFEKCS